MSAFEPSPTSPLKALPEIYRRFASTDIVAKKEAIYAMDEVKQKAVRQTYSEVPKEIMDAVVTCFEDKESSAKLKLKVRVQVFANEEGQA